MVFWFVDQGIFEWLNSFSVDDTNGQSLIEGSNITKGHNSWKSGISFGVTNVINQSCFTTSIGNKLGKLRRLLGDFSDASCGVLTDERINVLKAVENSWEDFCLHNNVGKLDSMFGNLGKTRTNVSFELCISSINE